MWILGGDDVGQEMRSALEFMKRQPYATSCASRTARCITVEGTEMPSGPVHAIFATVAYESWARGRHGAAAGPPYLRNASFPWGLPWITGASRDSLEQANQCVRDTLGLLRTLSAQHPAALIVFAFPECFGPAEQGRPASIWLLPELRQWAKRDGWCRSAVFQCELGVEDRRYPCGLLASEVLDSRRNHRGWPRFRPQDGKYMGPLPPQCTCGRSHDGPIETGLTSRHPQAALRPGLFRWLWKKLFNAGLLRSGRTRQTPLEARKSSSNPSDSSDDETWIASSSSSSPPRSTSPPSASTSAPRQRSRASTSEGTIDLTMDYDLAGKLGLRIPVDQPSVSRKPVDHLSNISDITPRSSLWNATAANQSNFENKVPTVKALQLFFRG